MPGGPIQADENISATHPDAITSTQSGTKRALDVNMTGGSDINIDANSVDTSGLVGKSSGGDFTTAYASAITITIGSLPAYHPTFIADDVVSVYQIATDGSVTNIYHRDDVIMSVGGNVLTVAGATFVGTDTFVIYTNIQREMEVQGDTAHDAADAGNPVKVGGVASAADATAVDEGDRVDASYDLEGKARGVVEGNLAHDAVDAGNPVAIGGIAKSAQQVAVATGDRVKSVFNLFGELVVAGYDWASNAIRTSETDPISQHHVEETLLDLTNIAQTTTAYAYLDMDGYRGFSLQGETSGATPTDVLTVTIEATNQDDGTAPASCAYQDVTNALFGVASWVDVDFFAVADTEQSFKYVRVKYTTSTGGGNDADLTVYAKRTY